MKDLTIIYYSSCREDETFEQKIKDKLLEVCGNIPIISVSQKPIDLGKNICVGEVGACNANLFRQIQVGCKEAKTPFVISVEADCLYPPDYFQFIPKDIDECYRFAPLYILNEWGKEQYSGFYRKNTAPFAQITGREHFIKEIDKILKDRPYWSNPKDPNPPEIFWWHRWKTCTIKNPIISLKTGNGLRKHTQIIEPPVDSIPYWGTAKDLRRSLWG